MCLRVGTLPPVSSDRQDGKPADRREGRIARHLRLTKTVARDPISLLSMLRNLMVEVWRSRGGGFYGLGYLIALVVLQVGMFAGDLADSESVSDFALAAAVEYLLRFSVMAFVNAFLALLWPLYVLEQLGGMGIMLLVVGYLAFEFALRPVIERFFPELREKVSPDPDQ